MPVLFRPRLLGVLPAIGLAVACLPTRLVAQDEFALNTDGQPVTDNSRWQVGTTFGYRDLEVTWATAAASANGRPDPPFEARWRNLGLISGGTSVEWTCGTFIAEARADIGRIVDGTSSESGYADDARTSETYHFAGQVDSGYMADASLALGAHLLLPGDNVVIMPLVGYSFTAQHMVTSDGHQSIPVTGSYAGTDSTYDATWHGPWLGAAVACELGEGLSLHARWEYHWAAYHGTEDLNLRADLEHPDSIVQRAHGTGVAGAVALAWMPNEGMAVSLGWQWSSLHAQGGTDQVNFADGTRSNAGLDTVKWFSWAVDLGISWRM